MKFRGNLSFDERIVVELNYGHKKMLLLLSQQCKENNPIKENILHPTEGQRIMGNQSKCLENLHIRLIFFMHFCPGTITTHAESINSDLQRGLDRRLRHTQH